MHSGQAGRVGEIHLSDGKGKGLSVYETDDSQTLEKLTKQMCDTLQRVPTAEIDRPLPLDRAVRQRLAMESFGH